MPIAELLLVNPSTPPYRLAKKTRSATPAQMAARARFAEMARARAGMRSNPELVVKSRATGEAATRGGNVAAMLGRRMGAAAMAAGAGTPVKPPTVKPPRAPSVKPPKVSTKPSPTVKPPRAATAKPIPTVKPPRAPTAKPTPTVKPPRAATIKPTVKPPKAATVKPAAAAAAEEKPVASSKRRGKGKGKGKGAAKPTAKPTKKPTAKPAKPTTKPAKPRRPRGPAKAPALPENATAAQKKMHTRLQAVYRRLGKSRIVNKRGTKPTEAQRDAAHRDRWERRIFSARKAAMKASWDVSTGSRTVPKGLGRLATTYGLVRVNPASMGNLFAFSDVSKLAPEIGIGTASLAVSAIVGQKIVDMIPAETQAKTGAVKPYLPAIASLLTGIAGYAVMRAYSKSDKDIYARGAVPTLYGGVFGATVHALIAAGKAAGWGIPQGMLAPAAPAAPAKAAAIPGATPAQTAQAIMSASQAVAADAMEQAAKAGQVGPTMSMPDGSTAGLGDSHYLLTSGGTDVAVGEYAAISGDSDYAQLDEARQGGRGLMLDPTVDSFYAQQGNVLSGTIFD